MKKEVGLPWEIYKLLILGIILVIFSFVGMFATISSYAHEGLSGFFVVPFLFGLVCIWWWWKG